MKLYKLYGWKSVSAALALGALAIGSTASADPILNVTVGGNSYALTTVEGSFASLEPLLESQPWWMDEALADAFATEMQGGLGFPHVGSGNLSPFLAVDDTAYNDPDFVRTTMWRESDGTILDLAINRSNTEWNGSSTPNPITYLVTVPEPASVGLVGLCAGGIFFTRRIFMV